MPGAISAWAALHERFGKLPFADVLEPAAEIAERGHTIAPIVAHKWAAAIPELHNQPGYAQAFMPHGRAPEVGEKIQTARRSRHAAPPRPDQWPRFLRR